MRKFTNLSINTIYNIKYKRYTDLNKFNLFNLSNKINNFNINYIKKRKPIFKIENKSFQYFEPKFSIEKTENIIYDKTIKQKVD